MSNDRQWDGYRVRSTGHGVRGTRYEVGGMSPKSIKFQHTGSDMSCHLEKSLDKLGHKSRKEGEGRNESWGKEEGGE